MAGETIGERGSWVSILTAASVADAALSAASASIAASLTTGQESNYPLLDFQLDHTAGTIAANATVNLYARRSANGANAAPVPNVTDYLNDYVGTFKLDGGAAATSYAYISGVDNWDPSATFYMENKDGTSALTIGLSVRGRTYKAAA